MSNMSFLAIAMLVVLITLSWSQPGKAAPTWAKANPERAAKMKPGEYVTVTSGIDGSAYASSEYDNEYFAAEKAFGTSSCSWPATCSWYWMSKLKRVIDVNSTHPIQLWFEFNERKRVTKIKFEEKYGLKSGQDYKIFASEAVGDCGNIKKQIVLATAEHGVFKTGLEFENKRSFRCYGIKTERPGKRLALALYGVMFGFEGQKDKECTPKLSYGCLSVPCCDGVACFEASGYMDYDKGEWIPATGKCLAYGATM